MKMKYELATLALWLIAILITLWFVQDSETLSFLTPLYFICMLGSIMVVRWAKKFSGEGNRRTNGKN